MTIMAIFSWAICVYFYSDKKGEVCHKKMTLWRNVSCVKWIYYAICLRNEYNTSHFWTLNSFFWLIWPLLLGYVFKFPRLIQIRSIAYTFVQRRSEVQKILKLDGYRCLLGENYLFDDYKILEFFFSCKVQSF